MAEVKKRGHVRVDDILKVDYRQIAQEDYKRCKSKPEIIFNKTFGEPIKVPEIEGGVDLELLYKLIYQTNLKIDHILNILESKDTEKYTSAGSECINISGSGMRLAVNHRFLIGDIIAFRVFLPLSSRTWINVLGKVMSVTESESDSENRYSTAVKFIDLSEVDQEMIIRYVFKRQRELLRLGSDVKNEKNDQIVD
ncbi:MAG: PilZ domain-containing protein [Desulfobacterales bacterium]|nr:PilZ domain-containing protein [Desulfobacterales bacterium]